jgi:predicted transcriptional regulator
MQVVVEHHGFSRRERQIMDVIWRNGKATAADVQEELPDAPGYSTVRTLLGVLERKGHLRHERRGHHYVYYPTVAVREASDTALERVLDTFFEGSAAKLVSAVLDLSETDLEESEYREILRKIEEARKEGR